MVIQEGIGYNSWARHNRPIRPLAVCGRAISDIQNWPYRGFGAPSKGAFACCVKKCVENECPMEWFW